MAKTYDFVLYDDDGKGVTSSITEYDRVDGGQLSYVGRAWLDVDETKVVLEVVSSPAYRAELARMDRMITAAERLMRVTDSGVQYPDPMTHG